jgi:hypothetical protein
VNADQPCWSCTQGRQVVPTPLPKTGDLWNSSADFYQGQTISRLDVAALGPGAQVLPGITKLPPAGTYYASPALAALIRSVPADELGDRFPGKMIGTIGQAALSGPGDLVVYVGYPVVQANAIAGTTWVRSINTAPGQVVFSPFFRLAFGAGALAVLFPILVLIASATRLAASRREERFAALRLVGGTPGDIRVIAAADAVIGSFLGAVVGTIIFLLVRSALAGSALAGSALAGAALVGTQYFESWLTPTVYGYIGMLIGVPAAAAVAALMSLRRVQISPLGVTRRAAPAPPSYRRLAVLVIGVGIYVFGLLVTTRNSIGAATYPGILLTLIGLVIAGPWPTARASGILGRLAPGSSALLAARRIADNPKGAFRSVSGLVLAVFLGTVVGLIAPALNQTGVAASAASLNNVLVAQIGLAPAGQQLVKGLSAIPGSSVYPLHTLQPGSGQDGSDSAKNPRECPPCSGLPTFTPVGAENLCHQAILKVIAPLAEPVAGGHRPQPGRDRRLGEPGRPGHDRRHLRAVAGTQPGQETAHLRQRHPVPAQPERAQVRPPQRQCPRIRLDGIRRSSLDPQVLKELLGRADHLVISVQHRPRRHAVRQLQPLGAARQVTHCHG